MAGRSSIFLIALALCLQLQLSAQQELPHVSECQLCYTCHLTKDKDPNARPQAYHPGTETPEVAATKIVPNKVDLRDKLYKPNCTECWGCSTRIEPLKAIKAFGHDFPVEVGASSEWLVTAELPDTHITGRRAIVKIWCMPVNKVSGKINWNCEGDNIAMRGAQHLVALDKVTEECGMTDITIRVWLAPVNAVLPGLGIHVWWYGLWMERAEGLSMNQIAYLGKRDLVEKTIVGLLQDKLNKTRVVHAAIYDLLISQCDRHSQNVFINEHGSIKLIDNLQSLKFSWQHCSVDSIFLPGTQKNEIIRWGGNLVSKRVGMKRRKSLNPLLLLDYRCYAPDGKIGTNYPPALTQCLKKISGMSPAEIRKTYGFPDASIAEFLNTRATDMLNKGFEWTLKRGKPVNRAPLRYKWYAPCCKIAFDPKGIMMCGHEWNVEPEFPYGDALRGGPWKYTYPDPGKYDGDELWGDKKSTGSSSSAVRLR